MKLKFNIIILFTLLSLSGKIICGTLSDFEKDISDSKKTNNEIHHKRRHYNSVGDKISKGFFEGLISFFKSDDYILTEEEKLEIEKESSLFKDDFENETMKNKKNFSLEIDANYQNIESNLYALDYSFRFELIHFPIVRVKARFTSYREKKPSDKLDLFSIYTFIPLRGNIWEADIGLGLTNINGDTNNIGFSSMLPITVHFNKIISFTFLPAISIINSHSIRDYDIKINFAYKKFSINTGYRWLNTRNTTIDGFYSGINIKF